MINGTERAGEWRTGWPVLITAFVAVFWMNLITYPTGVLVKPIGEAWGWSRGQTTLLLSFHALMTMVLGPAAGLLVRRTGVWRLSLIAVLLSAMALFGISFAGPNLTLWYLGWAAFGIAQLGCTVIVWAFALTHAFDRHRGLALALALCGSGAAATIMPPLTLMLYNHGGIGGTYQSLALIMLATMLPLLLLGLVRKHGAAISPGATHQPLADKPGMTLRQAVRTRSLWLLGLGMMMAGGAVAAVIVHVQALLTDRGLTMAQAAYAMVLLGPTMIVGRLCTGWLLDRLTARNVVALVFAFPATACFLLAGFNGSLWMAVTAILCTGLAAGAEGDMLAYFASRYFGTAHFGSIYGMLLGLFGVGYGGMPPLAGFLFDRLGSYNLAFGIFGIGLIAGAVCLLMLGRYPDAYAARR